MVKTVRLQDLDQLQLVHGIDILKQPVHVDAGLQSGQQLQTCRADGDGNGDGQQTLGDLLTGGSGLVGNGQILDGLSVAAVQVEGGDQAADAHAQNGAAGSQRNAVKVELEQHRSGNTHHQLHGRLQHLRGGGGRHVALTLEEATVGAHQADQKRSGGKDRNGGLGIWLTHKFSQRTCKAAHQQRADQTQAQENGTADGVDLPHLTVVTQRAGLGDHPAHGHRQAGRGDHQQHIVDLISGVEVAEALLTDDGIEGNFIQRANDLDHRSGKGKQRRSMQEILLFRFRHWVAPYRC